MTDCETIGRSFMTEYCSYGDYVFREERICSGVTDGGRLEAVAPGRCRRMGHKTASPK